MKKILYVIVIIISLLTSCNDDIPEKIENGTDIKIDGITARIYEIDGCEYYKWGHYDASWGTHKGNCKNPIHHQYKAVPFIYHTDTTTQIFPIDSVVVRENKIFCFIKGKLKFVSELKKGLLL